MTAGYEEIWRHEFARAHLEMLDLEPGDGDALAMWRALHPRDRAKALLLTHSRRAGFLPPSEPGADVPAGELMFL